MYKQNTKFSPIKDKKLGMRNSDRINQTGFGGSGSGGGNSSSGGGYLGGVSHGRVTKNYGNRQFNLQDVTKLKQLCTATNEWIQQKSSELLNVLRPENKGGDNFYRTVTLQSGTSNMNFGQQAPSLFDQNYKNNNFQQQRNSSEVSNFDYLPLNKSRPANMHYEENQECSHQEERDWGFEPNNVSVKPKNRAFSVIEKMKRFVNDKPFTINNAAKLFVDAINASGTSYSVNYSQVDNRKPYNVNLIVENLVLGVGKSFAKKKGRNEAYVNALNRLKNSSLGEICGDSPTDKPESSKLSYQSNIEPDPTRPVSALVIRETHKTATRREKHATSILRRSVYFSKMSINKLTSMVGNLYKVTILVQNKPVGIGFGSSVTKASVNAAGDALFNNFYRKNPVLQTREDDDSSKWIHWTNIKYLAKEMERIGGHSLIAGQNISNRSFATAIRKLVDAHPWNEVNSDLIFGPGMSDSCVQTLYSIAKERNLNFEERQHREFGNYYIIQRYFDPIDIVNYVERNGGCVDKYRLVPKSEISQIQCEHWEPKSQAWNQEQVDNEDLKLKSLTPKKPGGAQFSRMGESSRNFDTNSSRIGSGFNNGTFGNMSNNKQKRAINDDQDFAQMPHSKEKYFLPNNNDIRFNEKFTQGKDMRGFDDGEYIQMSRSDREFIQMSRSDRELRQISNSSDRESKQMSWADDRGFGQRSQSDDRGFGQRSQLDDRGFGQRSQSDNRGFGSGSQSDDRGFGQRSQLDNRGFGQRSQSDNRGFGSGSQSDDRGFGQRSQSDDRGFGQRSQSDNRGFGQRSQSDNRGFGQRSQMEDREFGQRSQSDDRGFRQMSQSDNRGFDQMRDREEFEQSPWFDSRDYGQMCQSDDREFRQRSQPSNEESSQATWHDNGEFKQNYWRHGKKLNPMSDSHDRELRETSKHDSREFRRTCGLDDHEFNQMRGMSDNFDREFSRDKNQTLGHEERRFNNMPSYTDQDFNQISDNREREFNLQFHRNERDREHGLHSYDKERFGQNPYENKLDKLSGHSDGFHHSSNYDKRFNKDFDKQISGSDKHYNQLRNYDKTSCDDNRHYGQAQNYDDRRLRFNDQIPCMDRQNNQRNPDDAIDPKRMQNNAPWNNMQITRGDGRSVVSNSIRYPLITPMTGVAANAMVQSMMTISQDTNKDQLTALRFLTKKIAHTALHANVKSILANARRLSYIAKERSKIEKSGGGIAKKTGKGTEVSKFQKPVLAAQPKTATSNAIQNSKSSTQNQSALNPSTNKRNRRRRYPRSAPQPGNTIQKSKS